MNECNEYRAVPIIVSMLVWGPIPAPEVFDSIGSGQTFIQASVLLYVHYLP